MGAHTEDTVVPNLLLGSIGLHIYVQTPGPEASEGQEAASFQLFGVAMLRERLMAQDGTTG